MENMATPDLAKLDLSDDDTEDLFASPSRAASKPAGKSTSAFDTAAPPTQHPSEVRYDAEQAREAALQRELEGLRSINDVIEGVVGSLERAKGNMGVSTS
jgi:hypothetical protein